MNEGLPEFWFCAPIQHPAEATTDFITPRTKIDVREVQYTECHATSDTAAIGPQSEREGNTQHQHYTISTTHSKSSMAVSADKKASASQDERDDKTLNIRQQPSLAPPCSPQN